MDTQPVPPIARHNSPGPDTWRDRLAGFDRAMADHAAQDWTGQAIFLNERYEAARAELGYWQAMARAGSALPPLTGLIMTVKACFDTDGWVSSCGSQVLQDTPPATRSAALVHTLRMAGATLLAQTNMTEFAYGALGVNTHFGTPRTPLDPTGARIAGGSSSGAAVGVARGYCDLAICSDTSGSARIPAAFCGVVGFKPGRGRYSTDGMHWLSTSFDVPGLITTSVAVCRRADHAITGSVMDSLPHPAAIRLAVPASLPDMGVDDGIRDLFNACVTAMTRVGITIEEVPLTSLADSARIAAEGRIIGTEAYALHHDHLATDFDRYDPVVATRLMNGRDNPACHYMKALRALSACRDRFDREIAGYDGFLLPTVPLWPPEVVDLRDEATYLTLNRHAFSLTEFANRLDLPSISLPVGKFPVGLMLTGRRGADNALLAMASVLEPLAATLHQPV